SGAVHLPGTLHGSSGSVTWHWSKITAHPGLLFYGFSWTADGGGSAGSVHLRTPGWPPTAPPPPPRPPTTHPRATTRTNHHNAHPRHDDQSEHDEHDDRRPVQDQLRSAADHSTRAAASDPSSSRYRRPVVRRIGDRHASLRQAIHRHPSPTRVVARGDPHPTG